jgi:poly(A) polymerase
MTDTYHYATRIVKRLVTAGYNAYFAGGWVRDLLLGHPSADIDIATDAPPQVILDLFERTIHVGLNFGVVIVAAGGHQFEVATFRRDVVYTNGRRPDSIEMSTAEEDAKRRDFTINGMFYDPLSDTVYDFVEGRHDLKLGVIRTIGDPVERFDEDRLRMLRAVRFAMRLGFHIDPDTQEAIRSVSSTLLPAVAMERVWQELTKMAALPSFAEALVTLHRLELLPVIFPLLHGIHLHTIKELVMPLTAVSTPPPASLALALLFPELTTDQLLEVFVPLRISNKEREWLISWKELQEVINDENIHPYLHLNREKWTRYYANPHSSQCLELMGAMHHHDIAAHTAFTQRHQERRAILQPHITRLQTKRPLVTAEALIARGFTPGIQLGQQLKRAESLAITQDLHETSEVLAHLFTNEDHSS